MSKYTETPAASPSNMAAADTTVIVCAADFVCVSALTDDFSLPLFFSVCRHLQLGVTPT